MKKLMMEMKNKLTNIEDSNKFCIKLNGLKSLNLDGYRIAEFNDEMVYYTVARFLLYKDKSEDVEILLQYTYGENEFIFSDIPDIPGLVVNGEYIY